jgi:hypothetical protein
MQAGLTCSPDSLVLATFQTSSPLVFQRPSILARRRLEHPNHERAVSVLFFGDDINKSPYRGYSIITVCYQDFVLIISVRCLMSSK